MADSAVREHDPEAAREREAKLREAIGHLNAATAKVVELVGAIDADGSWGDHWGCLSPIHLLSWQCGVGRRDATRWVATARRLSELPATREGFEAGRLSLTQVESIGRVATPATDSSYAELANKMTAAQLDRLTKTARRCKRLQEQEAEDLHRKRFLSTRFDDDGSYLISGLLAPEAGAVVEKALDRAEDEVFAAARDDDAPVTEAASTRRADALAHVAEAALASDGDRCGADATQVVVHITPDVLVDGDESDDESSRCEIEPGVGLSSETARRLCCDASFVTLLWGVDGSPLNSGRKTRRISPALRRALNARDQHCQFPGCTNTRFRDAHHILHWIRDRGETKIENLVSLCRRHHRMVHEGKCSVERKDDGGFVFYDPWGKVIAEVGTPVSATGPPLAERHAVAGLDIDGETCRPDWIGDLLNDSALNTIIGHHQQLEENARRELDHPERPPPDSS